MESAGNDDGGLARRHVLRTPFSTSLECSKITFALNSARKQTTVVPARAEPRAPLALDRHPVSSLRLASPPFVAVLVHSFVPQHRSVSSISRRSTLIPLSLPPTHLCPLPSREPTRRLSRPAGGGGGSRPRTLCVARFFTGWWRWWWGGGGGAGQVSWTPARVNSAAERREINCGLLNTANSGHLSFRVAHMRPRRAAVRVLIMTNGTKGQGRYNKGIY